jgi:hypothetical protein
MSVVKCSVDGCSRTLQPLLNADPRDRDTWFYRECDVCLKPACEEHTSEIDDPSMQRRMMVEPPSVTPVGVTRNSTVLFTGPHGHMATPLCKSALTR